MSRTKRALRLGALGLVAAGATGCGVEGFFSEAFDDTNPRPGVRLSGTVKLDEPTVSVSNQDGSPVDIAESYVGGESYLVVLPLACYQLTRVQAAQGERTYRRLIARLSPPPPPSYGCGSASGALNGVTLDADSTAAMLIVEARLSAEKRTLSSYDPKIVEGVLGLMYEEMAKPGLAQDFSKWVGRIVEAGTLTGNKVAFTTPGLTADFQTATTALSLDFMSARKVDFDGDDVVDTSSTATKKFDDALATLAEQFNLDGCLDPVNIRVVFEVDFNPGLRDGNCDSINRFKWVTDEPNKQMYIVGGIHMDSPVQDAELDRSLGNPGSWNPNTIPMYDDGTNGDAVAGDNIWTIYYDMPRGTRVGYKYTWGKRRDLWTGTEEWPGNQRILEAVDVNGDGFVLRRDNFQDEATNKDLSNLNRQGMGSVTWETDANGDGIPDAQERMIDTDNDCVLDTWMTPAGVGPATIDCADIADQ